MGLFDFFKKKKTEEKPAQEQKENILEADGIEVETVVLEDEIALEEAERLEEPSFNFENEDAEEIADVSEEPAAESEGEEKKNENFAEEVAKAMEREEAAEDAVEIAEKPEVAEDAAEESEIVEESAEENAEESGIAAESVEEVEIVEDAAIADASEEATETVAESESDESAAEIAEEEEVAEEIAEEPAQEEPAEEPQPKKLGFFAKLKAGLDKTRKNILGGVDGVLGAFTKIDEDLFEELEEALIMADMGVQTTMDIVENLRKRVKREHATDPSLIKGMLIDEITAILQEDAEEAENLPSPTVMLVIGVNGVGKTTTIGKLAHNFKQEGKSVLLAAADTFRAAAIDQLEIWGERSDIAVIKHEENSDPAAVVYDAVHEARKQHTDLLICDTAGRLHNKKNLMEELKKIARVIEREHPDAHKEVYLVLDATTGQNALQQAKLFREVADITGIILTKLDGTAKGGIVVAIKSELKIPVRYIGVGEGIDDLQKFDAAEFAGALFGKEAE